MKKILVVGYGSIGKRHVNNLLSIPNIEIIICTKRKNLKLANKRIKIFNSLQRALKEKPNIGFVTNETSKHVQIANDLSKQGLDLFLEKPLSNSIIGIKTLEKIVEKKDLVTQMGCNFRFHPCIIKIKKIIDEGSIGKIIVAHVESGSYLPDWHPYEDYRMGYAANDHLGGGIVLTCIHEIDYLYWFFGDVKEVFSITGKFSDLEVTSDDMSSIILKFKNNIITELHLDYFQRPDFKSCKIKGTKGTIYWDSDKNEVKVFLLNENKWKTIMKLKEFQRNQLFVDELKHFLKCVKTHKSTINDIQQGIQTLKISLAIKKSSKLKRMVKI